MFTFSHSHVVGQTFSSLASKPGFPVSQDVSNTTLKDAGISVSTGGLPRPARAFLVWGPAPSSSSLRLGLRSVSGNWQEAYSGVFLCFHKTQGRQI